MSHAGLYPSCDRAHVFAISGGSEVAALIAEGEVIANYPDDTPHPSVLLLGFVEGRPMHVVAARNERTSDCYVVTVYVPDAAVWSDDFRARRDQ